MRFAQLFIFTLLAPLACFSQIEIQARLDTLVMLQGDHNSLKINFLSPENQPPDSLDTRLLDSLLSPENIFSKSTWKPRNGSRGWQLDIQFTAFDTGFYHIEPMPIFFKKNGKTQSDETPPLVFHVAAVVVNDSTALAPIKAIREEPTTWLDYLPMFLAMLAVIAAAVFIYFWVKKPLRKTERPAPPPIQIPSWQEAAERLDILEEKQLWQAGETKIYHSELTEILRVYLSKRFQIRAVEATTDEILAALRKTELPETTFAQLKNLFETVDLVKFAQAEPPSPFHELAMRQARDFVALTTPQVVENQEVSSQDGSNGGSISTLADGFSKKSKTVFSTKMEPIEVIAPAQKSASVSRRLVAGLIDTAVWLGGSVASLRLVFQFVEELHIRDDGGFGTAVISLACLAGLAVFAYIFHVFLEKRGFTPGKFAFGMRTLDETGQPMTHAQAVRRALLKLNPMHWGLRGAATDPRHQAEHDAAAGTIVILKK